MAITKNIHDLETESSLSSQPCVRAIMRSSLPNLLKKDLDRFIRRNVIPSCGRVSPNCLKAHMLKVAKRYDLSEKRMKSLNKLFKSNVGYRGYYLDNGRLRRV